MAASGHSLSVMDEFYAKRIHAEIERIADCTDSGMLGVEDDAGDDEIIHAYETQMKNLGTNRCGYSPETRELARELFSQLRNAAKRLGVEVEHIDEAYGLAALIATPGDEEAPEVEEAEDAGNALGVSLGESGEFSIPNPATPSAPTDFSSIFNSVLPSPVGPPPALMVPPPMVTAAGPNPSNFPRAGSPPFPTALPRAATPTPMPIFPPGVPFSPGMMPMNTRRAPIPRPQTWPALGSAPQPHPAFDALQKRAETAEAELAYIRKDQAQAKASAEKFQVKLKSAETIVADLTKRLRAAEKLALMLRNSHSEIKAKLAALESEES